MSEYRLWSGSDWITLPVPDSGGEQVVVPNINAIIWSDDTRSSVLLQRRDKPGEVVRGRWEIPGGRWRAGEGVVEALTREVEEETGLTMRLLGPGAQTTAEGSRWTFEAVDPFVVVVATGDAYPSLHIVFECVGEGHPRPLPGETAEPTWWLLDDLADLVVQQPTALVGPSRAVLTRVLGL